MELTNAPRSRGGFASLLSVLALCIAGYLVLDRFGVFRPVVKGEPRAITARGDLAGFEKSAVSIFENNAPSVVNLTHQVVRGFARSDVGTASGFVWDEAGHVVTNYHVVERVRPGTDRIQVRMADRREYTAFVVGVDPERDIAVLRLASLPSALRPVPVGTSKDLKVGQAVFAIGNPFGLNLTLTSGLVSALDRSIPTQRGVPLHGLIQTDAAINPGNSGGPLFDSAGRLIGMNTAIFSKSEGSIGIGFAVPVDVINRVVPDLIARKSPERVILGVVLYQTAIRIPGSTSSYAVPISQVAPGYGAEEAGLRALVDGDRFSFPGDAILAIDDTVVESASEIMQALASRSPGDRVRVKVARFRNEEDPPSIETVQVRLKAAR
ncbi:MAG: trypsin-like peptidase domain-containing protein [Planctomycetes bacterium]|nr:trypsin-like peptidase domain-containing protein [Planctomycetota bacterium]MCB9871842.1 trypsin-like peptidase domain-containing protein [Planctomycetota bacterium]